MNGNVDYMIYYDASHAVMQEGRRGIAPDFAKTLEERNVSYRFDLPLTREPCSVFSGPGGLEQTLLEVPGVIRVTVSPQVSAGPVHRSGDSYQDQG